MTTEFPDPTFGIVGHKPCRCKDYSQTFHEGEKYCPAWGRQSAQCAECHGCKFCRLAIEGDNSPGGAFYWMYSPVRYYSDSSEEAGRRALANTFSAIVVRCHFTAVSKGFWAEDVSLVDLAEGVLPPSDKNRHFAENLMWAVREIGEAFDDWQRGNEETIAEELADAIIILMDAAEGHGYDITTAIIDKMEKNRHRPVRHGGKRTS